MRSLFGRFGKYSATAELDPRENRLTESFAAVLERVDGLAEALVAEWLGYQSSSPVRVSTQRLTASRLFIDLELAFGSDVKPDLLVWIENKHGAELHHPQLEDYLEDIERQGATTQQVVLLAPRAMMPVRVPPGVVSTEWQDVAVYIRGWRHAAPRGAVADFLIDELSRYLKEEGLADQELTPELALAFSRFPQADAAIGTIIELADKQVQAQWGDRTDPEPRRRRQPRSWWAHYGKAARGAVEDPRWHNVAFEWALKPDYSRLDGRVRDALAFVAGATFFGETNPVEGKEGSDWLRDLADKGFVAARDDLARVWRYHYPEQLLVETTLEGQAEALGRWVVDAFCDLAITGPPSS